MGLMIFWVIAGLVILLICGDLLVRGAVGLAQALKIPPLAIGLTIVAFGTSAPELVVTLKAVLAGEAGIAIGNIIGSNIANILLVLGVPALIYPIACIAPGLRRNTIFMLAATALFAWIAATQGEISFVWGAVLFTLIVAFVGYTGLRVATGRGDDPLADEIAELEESPDAVWRIAIYIGVGLVGLPLGAHLLVENGADIARSLDVREELIGLTLVAFGTSLPELATVIVAALRKHSSVALGNVIGSNLFNLLAVGGAAGLAGGAAFTDLAVRIDIPVMAGAALLIAAFIFLKQTINRVWGAVFALGYILYIGFIGSLAGIL